MPTASLQWARSISEGVHIGTVFHFFLPAPFSPGQVACLIPPEIIPDCIGIEPGLSGCPFVSESLVEKLKAFPSLLVGYPWLYDCRGSLLFHQKTSFLQGMESHALIHAYSAVAAEMYVTSGCVNFAETVCPSVPPIMRNMD